MFDQTNNYRGLAGTKILWWSPPTICSIIYSVSLVDPLCALKLFLSVLHTSRHTADFLASVLRNLQWVRGDYLLLHNSQLLHDHEIYTKWACLTKRKAQQIPFLVEKVSTHKEWRAMRSRRQCVSKNVWAFSNNFSFWWFYQYSIDLLLRI